MAQIHHAKSSDQRKRHGHTGNDGGPNIPQKSKNHKNHEDDGNDERYFHVVDRRSDRGSTVNGDAQMERGRYGRAEERKKRGNAVYRLDHVSAGLAKNGQK